MWKLGHLCALQLLRTPHDQHGGRLVADSAAERFFGAKKGRALSDREYPKDIYRCAGLGLYMNIITPETHFRAVYTTISRFEDLKLSANS